MVELQREMDEKRLASKVILQVHDELLFEVERDELGEVERLVQDIMPKALELSIPLKVDIKTGKTWNEMELSRERRNP